MFTDYGNRYIFYNAFRKHACRRGVLCVQFDLNKSNSIVRLTTGLLYAHNLRAKFIDLG